MNPTQQTLEEGQAYYFAKPPDCDAALSVFQRVTELSPDWHEGFHWLGCVLQTQNRHADAIPHFQRSHQLAPDDPRPLIALGIGFVRLARYDEAIAILTAAISLKPHYSEADTRLELADAYVGANRLEDAITQWRIVSQMEPNYPSYVSPIDKARQKLVEHGITQDA
jgi:Flp pilus assembly protein TadD